MATFFSKHGLAQYDSKIMQQRAPLQAYCLVLVPRITSSPESMDDSSDKPPELHQDGGCCSLSKMYIE